jgi:PAS domain S-box-containing protein
MIRVLYVDDDPLLLETGRLYLQKLGNFTVDTAESVAKALKKLGEGPYDAIISDYQMPVMDGLSFLKHLRESRNSIPFILFTGKGREEVVIEALNNGADYYLQKGGQPKAQYTELIHKVRLAVEKRQAENNLRRSHRQIKDMLDHLPDPTFAIDRDGIVIAWNRAQVALTGHSGEEIIGKGEGLYALAIYGERRPMLVDAILKEYYSNIIRDQDTITAETRIKTVHGNKILWGKASPLYDETGNITGAIQTVRDITRAKKAEQELVNSKQMLSDIIDFLPDPTFAIDKKGAVIAWNHAIEEMTGVKKQEIIGKGEYIYSLPFYGETRPILIDFLYKDWEEISYLYEYVREQDGHLVAEVYSPRMYDGRGAWLWGITAPLKDADGKINGAIQSIRDITERKKTETELLKSNEELAAAYEELSGSYEEINASMEELKAQKEETEQNEARFRSLIEHVPDGILIVRKETISYANPAACEMLMYGSERELTGRPVFSIVDPPSLHIVSLQISSVKTLQNSCVEVNFLRADERAIPVEMSAFTCPGPEEDVIVIIRNITRKNSVNS